MDSATNLNIVENVIHLQDHRPGEKPADNVEPKAMREAELLYRIRELLQEPYDNYNEIIETYDLLCRIDQSRYPNL